MTRVRLNSQLEQSTTPGSIPASDASNELNYLTPGVDSTVLSIEGGLPAYKSISATATSGLSFTGNPASLAFELDINRLTTVTTSADTDLLAIYNGTVHGILLRPTC